MRALTELWGRYDLTRVLSSSDFSDFWWFGIPLNTIRMGATSLAFLLPCFFSSFNCNGENLSELQHAYRQILGNGNNALSWMPKVRTRLALTLFMRVLADIKKIATSFSWKEKKCNVSWNSSLSSQIERGHIFFDIYKDMRKKCQCQIQVHSNTGQILRKKTNLQHFQFIPQHFHFTSKSAVFKRKVVLSPPFLKPFGDWQTANVKVVCATSNDKVPFQTGVFASWTQNSVLPFWFDQVKPFG